MERIEFISKSPSDTWDIGEHIGRHVLPGDCYALYGDLGAGKTQLVKGIARGIGVSDWLYVVSPSFTLMNVYEGSCSLCHVDLYRIDGAETDDLDMEEYLEKGIVVIEWAERAILQEGVIKVYLDSNEEEQRKIILEVEDVSRAEVWRNFRKGH
ncbi:MAG: tRNA (adenosine(37)-N6)-threonylcarbamoyltransferase complex ATPase subunit type 1 TsaE [Syntrophus sp. (in: bacteria)]|nr:tRNA (adenosine(37)-N6)-threonylcarbamoyltransferase complex ATPase subunit type 1 TsaE [Syntrophus sp. (in: bacteria)]